MATTIRDVANEANVSVASVSRAINGSGGLSAKTRKRILHIAQRLNYTPHGAARSLVMRCTHAVGVLLPDMHGEFFSELIRGIDRAARSHGLHLLLSGSHDDPRDFTTALQAMHGRVDGLLVMAPHAIPKALAANLPDAVPTVLIGTSIKGRNYPSFCVDNFGGASSMVRHLIGRGHRRIALIAGPERNFEARERLRAYRETLAQLLPGAKERVFRGDFTEESGARAAAQILALAERPTAIFASNDMMAIGCMLALREAGVMVPRDIAIAGFDDIPIARYVSSPLTSVRVRIAELGALALERLVLDIRDPGTNGAMSENLRTELVIRASCGRAPVVLTAVGSSSPEREE